MDDHLEKLRADFVRIHGKTRAAILIMESLKCSLSKSMKISGGRYPSKIPDAEACRLAELFRQTTKRPPLLKHGKSAAS